MLRASDSIQIDDADSILDSFGPVAGHEQVHA